MQLPAGGLLQRHSYLGTWDRTKALMQLKLKFAALLKMLSFGLKAPTCMISGSMSQHAPCHPLHHQPQAEVSACHRRHVLANHHSSVRFWFLFLISSIPPSPKTWHKSLVQQGPLLEKLSELETPIFSDSILVSRKAARHGEASLLMLEEVPREATLGTSLKFQKTCNRGKSPASAEHGPPL